MPTIKEIAELSGYSPATVSRTLNNDNTLAITAEARVRILSAAESLGYVRKRTAPEVQKPRKIALVSSNATFRNEIDSGYYFSMRSGIEDEAKAFGAGCDYIDIKDVPAASGDYDGVVIVGHLPIEDYDLVLKHFKTKCFVAINTVYFYPELLDHVGFDNGLCTKLALEHLFSKGHTRIAFIGHREFDRMRMFSSRKETFIEMMKEKGFYEEGMVHECSRGVEQSYEYMKACCERKMPMPTAFFCANDPVAIGTVKALTEYGFRVPEDISIVSVDGSFITRFSNPPISSVNVHTYEQGRAGVKLLRERIGGLRDFTVMVELTPQLEERESVAEV